MSAAPAEEKFSYLEILGQGWAYLRANSRLLLISTVVATVAGLVAAHVTRLEYRASLIVAPQEGVSTAGSMSGLQDLAGLASGSGGSDATPFQPFSRFAQTITSNSVADKLAQQPGVLQAVLPKQWDETSRSWHPPSAPLSSVKQGINNLLGLSPWHPPGFSELQDVLDNKVRAVKLGRNPAYTLTFSWRDPNFAARVLTSIVEINNGIIQQDAQARFSRTIEYLKDRLRTETELNRRNALNQILIEQERSLMAAGAHGPYAAKVIDRLDIKSDPSNKFASAAIAFAVAFLMVFGGVKLAMRRYSATEGRANNDRGYPLTSRV